MLLFSLLLLKENHEEFVNVDFWYMPCNYSIVDAPVVMAKFVENQKCQLDISVEVQGELAGSFFWFCFLFLFFLICFLPSFFPQALFCTSVL